MVATELLFGFRERPVDNSWFSVLRPDRRCSRRRTQFAACLIMPAFCRALYPLTVLAHDAFALRVSEAVPLLLVEAAHQEILHRLFSSESIHGRNPMSSAGKADRIN